jgi:hydrogenase-4 component B
VPIPARQSSYAPLAFFAVIGVVVVLTIVSVHFLYHQRIRRSAAWDCGFGALTSRMQDTAEGFGQPIRHLFQPFFAIVREVPSPFDSAPRYRLEISDRIWRALYQPLDPLVRRLADKVAWLQQGRIANYLLYSFVTLVVLLALML